MPDNEVNPFDAPVPPVELMAALSSLLVHDFSNHLSIISGNTQFAQLVANDPEKLGLALKSIMQASEMAADLLKRCGDLRRKVKGGFEQGDIAALRNLLRRHLDACGAWTMDIPPALSGRIALPSAWVALAAREIIRESAAPSGEVSLRSSERSKPRSAPASGSFGHVLEIRMTYQGSHSFPFAKIRSKCTNLLLLAAYELILNSGGWADFDRSQDKQRQPTLFVPMAIHH